MTQWPFEIAGSGLRFRQADPLASSLESFTCGPDWWSADINMYIRSAAWARAKYPETALEFGFDDAVVGYAVARVADIPHPTGRSKQIAPYVIVQVIAVATKFQACSGPGPGDGRYVDAMLSAMEHFAREEDTLGLRLQVEDLNARAIAVYLRNGYHREPGTAVTPGGARLISMRKVL